ncbi:MAG TPA: hypothetical protein VHE79_03355, partial [Spirochaetia bacterium]
PIEGRGEVTVIRPDGRSETVSGVLYDTAQTGFYTVKDARGSRDFAVSLASDTESDVRPRFASADGERSAGETIPASVPAWGALAIAALALVLLEWVAWLLVPRGRTS